MAAQLQQPADPLVVVPPAPQNPPTLADIYNAHNVTVNVLISSQQHLGQASTHDDISRALMYQHTVIKGAVEANQVVAPAGLGPLQNQLDAMQQNQERMLVQLRRQMRLDHNRVVTRLDDMHQQMINTDRRIICLANGMRHDGLVIPYTIVPFTDGDDPTQPPHNLVPLVSTAVIDTLSAHRCNRYLDGYEVDRPPGVGNVALRRQLLKRAIGVPV
ncbi:hypothetical protein BS47DRAFT_1340385 [Hydnum rufescens UP504]|uniref:Mug135-like C-terminal domain-containing protein n=1 Tax=Hydnum rufescens UP504 TaxID=1448309 RepID=A0A9P6DWT9_9AGAM|nr:hypothetical protein BS47DRAFT_1340385 [Hydnum rufescens UP504]